MNPFFTPTPPDPLDAHKQSIEDQMVQAATDKAHQEEARWLLTHMENLYPRFEANRTWYERWQEWLKKEKNE